MSEESTEKNIPAFNTSAIVTYYHVPPVWIDKSPIDDKDSPEIEKKFAQEVYSKELPQKIRAHVRIDGLFVFDFSSWEPGKSVAIPEISLDEGKALALSKELFKSVAVEQDRLLQRIEAINAHLACLYSCKPTVEPAYQVCSPSDHIGLSSVGQTTILARGLDYSPLQAFVKVHTEYEKYLSKEKTRGVLSLEIVEQSFALYERLLNCPVDGSLKLAVLLLQSAKACAEHDFATCVIFSWVVCERLITIKWGELIKENRTVDTEGGKVPFINSDRKKRLENSSVYSAAVMIEILSFQGVISLTMYEALTETRTKRNQWVHRLESIDYSAASKAIRVAQDLFDLVCKVRLKLNPGAQASIVPSA